MISEFFGVFTLFLCVFYSEGQDTAYPTSRPTGGYVAPSNHFVLKSLKPTSAAVSSLSPTFGHGAGIEGADNEAEEIKEETMTAMSSSYLMLVGLVFLIMVVVFYYAYKRYFKHHLSTIQTM